MVQKILSRSNWTYPATLFLFLALVGSLLLGLVDMRRGLVLSAYRLTNPWVNLNFHHLWWLSLGSTGLWVAYLSLRGWETRKEVAEERLQSLAKITAFALFALLTIDTLLLYRAVGTIRILEAEKMEIGTLGLAGNLLPGWAEVFPLSSTPLLLQPFAIMVNYMALVWHATLLALLWAGLGVVALPLYFAHLISPKGAGLFRSLMGGVVYAIPQPFCSCCAAPIAATLYKGGTPLAASIAFLLSSPTLNITAFILAATLLPLPFAVLRIIGGSILVVLASYLAAKTPGRLASPEAALPSHGAVGFVSRVFNRYCMLFRLEPVHGMALTPAGIIQGWAVSIWRMAKVVIPTIAVGAAVAGVIVTFVPGAFGNDFLGILLAAGLGTILMISTWTEIPVAAILASQGLTGPAAALLLTLPVISLPCLIIFGGALGSGRVPLLLGLVTFASGVVAGLLFM